MRGEQTKRILIFAGSHTAHVHVVAVGLGYSYRIGHFHYAFFYALKFVAGAGKHQQQEKVRYTFYRGLALPHSDRFYKNDLETSRLAQQHCLASFIVDTAQCRAGSRRTYVGHRIVGK